MPPGVVGGTGARSETGPADLQGMEDLAGTSGLPLWLDTQQGRLFLAQPGEGLRSEPQLLGLMRHVLLDRGAAGPEVLYWRFPNVALPTDEGVFDERGVRHSLLMLRPGHVGAEYVKTWGHTHACGAALRCPEVYGVLRGQALLLLQQQAEEPGEAGARVRLSDVRQVDALAGQKVVVPATYGVVVINPGSEPLVLSSLVAAQSSPVHQVYDRMRGAAYYITERDGQIAAEPNRHYAQPLPPLREDVPVRAPDLGVVDEEPLYSAFVHQPESFSWLLQAIPGAAGAP